LPANQRFVRFETELNSTRQPKHQQCQRVYERRNSFSAGEPSESPTYIKLNRQTACPPLTVFPYRLSEVIHRRTLGASFSPDVEPVNNFARRIGFATLSPVAVTNMLSLSWQRTLTDISPAAGLRAAAMHAQMPAFHASHYTTCSLRLRHKKHNNENKIL
jgi:hypothetical protein